LVRLHLGVRKQEVIGKMKKTLLITTLLSMLCFIVSLNAEESLEKQFEAKYQKWYNYRQQSGEMAKSTAGTSFTCPEFEDIVVLGIPVLPYIANKMESDSTAEILWKAIEVIAKVKIYSEYDQENNKVVFPDFQDLKPNEDVYLYWWREGHKQTPKQFGELYSKWKLLKQSNTKDSEKIYQRMINLGIPVIPFMMGKLDNGDRDLVSAISYLTDGEIKKDTSPKECINWRKSSSEKWKIKFDVDMSIKNKK
jgi:hypothetical protein